MLRDALTLKRRSPMQIAIDVPNEKIGFMVEFLRNVSFVKDVTTVGDGAKAVSLRKRKIGVLDGVGDVVFKNDWEMSEEELAGLK